MIAQFVTWYFLEIPAKIKKIWMNYLWFFAKYFALGQLVFDFFKPWKGLVFKREKVAFEFGDIIFTWGGNVISRFLGAFVRLIALAGGVAVEFLVLAAGIAAFFGWIIFIPGIFYCFSTGLMSLI